ncbi:GerMN domain-containing protein [Proteocatella sphenisci]|uniref:GerMN domain-containing protein n=1 Tax=Proteocatella sphenisci TaxID=181070 RepID=UPI00048EF877|nr:GerMN domain-containing protein [Proteocatella sphenisci]
MKKYGKIIASFLAAMLVMSGCNALPQPNEPDAEKPPEPIELKLELENFIQSEENTMYYYEGRGNEYARYISWVDYKTDDAIQLRVNNGGTETASVYRIDGDKLIKSFTQAETYHREDMTLRENNSQEVLLMEPLEEGTSWTLEDGSKRMITGVDAKVQTPSGDYTAIEVVTEYADSKTMDYYVSGIGLVKSVFESNGEQVISALENIEKDKKITQDVSLYYPDEEEKLQKTDVKLEFATNDSAEKVLTQAFKSNVPENAVGVIGENAQINSLYFEQETSTARIDLSKEFVTEMNAGSYYESLILQCLANTLRSYATSEKMSLTIDGGVYESGHIVLEKEDYIFAEAE